MCMTTENPVVHTAWDRISVRKPHRSLLQNHLHFLSQHPAELRECKDLLVRNYDRDFIMICIVITASNLENLGNCAKLLSVMLVKQTILDHLSNLQLLWSFSMQANRHRAAAVLLTKPQTSQQYLKNIYDGYEHWNENFFSSSVCNS